MINSKSLPQISMKPRNNFPSTNCSKPKCWSQKRFSHSSTTFNYLFFVSSARRNSPGLFLLSLSPPKNESRMRTGN
jgi:hypothetical protein